ncbi:hypothetical protein K525DRAFT_275111 [Schizophyllum commune Loenen D]|nr:hypothetical protein K525DRAFT_275111 [Schizophyllum commune Loenen D]
MRDAEAVNSGALVTEDREQRRKLDFKRSGGRRVVSEKRGEGVSCRSSADARELMGVALPRRFGEKLTSPGASAAGHVTGGLRAEVSSCSSRSSRDSRGHSARSTGHTCCKSPAQSLDSNGQCHALRESAERLSPSPSSATRIQATREPPDKAILNSSSLPTSHRSPSARVPSAAPLLRSCRRSTSGSGPDSVDWRTYGQPVTLSLREVGSLDAGLRSESIGKRERASEVLDLEEDVIKSPNASGDEEGSPQDIKSDVNVANLHRPCLEMSPPARDHSRVYTEGEVLALSRRNGNPESSRNAGKCPPRGAKSSTARTISEHSIRAQAMVKPRTQMSSHSSLDAPECSPPSTECDGSEEPVQPCINATHETPDKRSSGCSNPESYLPSSHQYPDNVLSHAPLLESTRGSDYESCPNGAGRQAQGRPAEAMQSEIDARDAGERTAVSPRKGINLGDARNGRKHSPRSAEAKRDRGENPAQFPDSNGHYHPPRASAGGLSPSPSTALHRQATCEPPDKTNSNDSSSHSGQSTSRPRSATVPSAAPPFRLSYPSTSESGHDSANWRAHGWLKALSRQEVGAVEADSRDKSISKCEKDEASSQASAQDRPQVYAGGQVLASSRRDAKPDSSSNAGKRLPQGVESDIIATVPEDSGRTSAKVEPHLVIGPGSSREIPECSPRSAEEDRGESTGLVPDSDGQVQVSQSSTENLTSSSSATPCIYATCEPSDETSDHSSPESRQPASHTRSPTVPTKFPAPLLRSSHRATAGSGPDSANWRVRGRPAASPLRKRVALEPTQQISSSSHKGSNLEGTRNKEWPEAHRDHTHSPLVVHMRRVHCASSTSALHPLRKDQEVDVPDARALFPPRQRRVGRNVLILRAEMPSRASSPNHAEVSHASTTARTSYSDATPQTGGRTGSAVTDGGCRTGYALGFYNDPGELIRAVSSGDANLSDVCGARAVVPSPACLSSRKVVRHAERTRTTFCLRGSSEEVFSANQKAPARLEDGGSGLTKTQ